MTWAKWQFCMRSICVAAACTIFISPAIAVSTPIEQAVAMLARSQAVNARCNYLTRANKMRLAELVQRARGALTVRENAKAAQTALLRGHDDGMAAACTAAERAKLNSTLAASNQAASRKIENTSANRPEIVAAPNPVPVKEAKTLAVANASLAPVNMKPKHLQPQVRREDDGLLYYAQILGDYFLARRCAPGDARGLNKMNREILITHNDLLRNHAASEVSVVLHRAERAAFARSCG